MSKIAQQIVDKLKDIAHRENDTMIGTIKSVDVDNAVCEVDVDGLTYSEVQLKSVMDSAVKGIKVIPANNSIVIVERIGKSNELFITMYSDIDAIYWAIGDLKLFFNKDGFVFNGGNNKGMVKLPELVQKLNNIENKLNELIAWSTTHTHTGVLVGFGSTSTAIGVTGTLTPTTESDIENPKIKQ